MDLNGFLTRKIVSTSGFTGTQQGVKLVDLRHLVGRSKDVPPAGELAQW